jgi:acetoin:2,6-dichlorophenolindophenol oxidoreductase subunit beta
MPTVSLVEAGRLAVRQEMRRDPRVWVLGEDVARGGLWGQYRDFLDEFGAQRIVSTPISEATIMGAGLGAALVGTRPIIEMRVVDFVLCAMDELVNQIAKVRYMFGGQARPALVVRIPSGAWRYSAAQHSQSLEAWFAHMPGLQVVAPSSPEDEAGLLVSAIRSDDPVVVIDPKDLWTTTGELPAGDIAPIPLGKARRLREGNALTIVTWSALTPRAIDAVDRLHREGIAVDLIELRSIWPWDADMVCDSAARTRRLLVTHEAVEAGGFGGEVVATVVERLAAGRLLAVKRLGAPRVPLPFSPPLEAHVRVTSDKIVAAAKALVATAAKG